MECVMESARLVFGFWSFSAMNVLFGVIIYSHREGGWHAVEISEPA